MTISQLRARVEVLFASARRRFPLLDHGVRAWEHTNSSSGFHLAAGVTYYAFLSFFPLVALVYALVGFAVDYVPAAREAVGGALASVLPGLIGDGPGRLDVGHLANAKAGAGIFGLLGLLYTGMGWISALRTALALVFGGEAADRGFFRGLLADLRGLVLIGAGLLVGVGFGTVLTGYAGRLASSIGFGGAHLLVVVLTELIVLASMTATIFGTFRLLPGSAPGDRGLLAGAVLAAFGFEALRLLATVIVRQFTANPLYGAFAVMVALLVWINYTARLIIFGAAWAVTTPGESAHGSGAHRPGVTGPGVTGPGVTGPGVSGTDATGDDGDGGSARTT